MSTKQAAKSEVKVNQTAVAQFIKEHVGKTIIEQTPKDAEGPITYVIAGVHDKKTMGLRPDNGGGKFGMVLIRKQGDETSEPKTLNPNVVLDLLAGREATGFVMGETTVIKTDEAPTGEATSETTAAGATEGGAEGGTTTETKDAAPTKDTKVADEKKAAAEQKRKDKQLAADKREADRKAKATREEEERKEREARKAKKQMSSGKIKALRVFRGEPETVTEGTTHRSRVMAKFRAPEKDGGLGMSMQHANTYYQNCKGIWAKDVLPTVAEQQAQEAEEAAAK